MSNKTEGYMKGKTAVLFIFVSLIITLVLATCSPSPAAIQAAIDATLAAAPSATLLPTSTPIPPSSTPLDTATSEPTETPQPSSPPLPTDTSTPAPTQATIEGARKGIVEATINFLNGIDEVKNVNLVRFNQKYFEIELQCVWASQDRQPNFSYMIIRNLAKALSTFGPSAAAKLGDGRDLIVKLTTYSADGDYRYQSETDFDTLIKVSNSSISYDEWVKAANAGFR